MHVVWTGERVRLRPFCDAQEWCALRQELDAIPNEFWGSLFKPQLQLSLSFEVDGLLGPNKVCAFAIERLDTGQLIGYERHRTPGPGGICASVGTLLLPPHWHRGFGIEAKQLCFCYLFENYPVERVEAATISHHLRACRGMEQAGMCCEGLLHGIHHNSGRDYDLLTYSIFREQWERLPIRQVVRRE